MRPKFIIRLSPKLANRDVRPAQSSLSDAHEITLVSPLQCQFLGALAVKLSVSKGNLDIRKILLDMSKGSPPLDLPKFARILLFQTQRPLN